MDHTSTPLLGQTEPKQPQRRLHRNLKVPGCQNGDWNHLVFMELANRWMDVKGHMDAHRVCEQRPSVQGPICSALFPNCGLPVCTHNVRIWTGGTGTPD